MKKCNVGGQALIEGIMMRGRKGIATAIRTSKGDIDVKLENISPITVRNSKFNIPFIRGAFILVDSMITGIKTLNYSASFIEDDEDDDEPSKFEQWLDKKFGDKAEDYIITATTIISIFVAILLFFGLPTVVASLFKYIGFSVLGLNLIEAIIRISLLITYCYLISKIDDINRTFQYHGAEHKTIFCYESGDELTIENVKKYSRFHPRCGTNFLFLIMFVSIIVFAFTGWGNVIQRLLLRIILIPLISGITYEIIKWLGSCNNGLAKVVAKPGLLLQKLTTKEPDDGQIEVAIVALRAAEGIKNVENTIGKLLEYGANKLKEANIDTYLLDSKVLLQKAIQKDKVYIMINKNEEISKEKIDIYKNYINDRSKYKPVKYITNEAEFMGLDFYVEDGVLIPRGDTEILVEEVLKHINEDDDKKILDLCCGSGAIGISIASFRKNTKIDVADLYDVPEKVTRLNISKHNLQDRVEFIKSDLFKGLSGKKYDIIVSNPPYIKNDVINTLMDDVKLYEPLTALEGGDDGLIFYREIIEKSSKFLNNGGILAFEIGHDQGIQVKELMESAGYDNVYVVKDLASLDRVVLGYLKVD